MGIISHFTLKYILDFDVLRDIRSDWTHFYNEAYHSEKFRAKYDFDSLDSSELQTRAITSMESAVKYRPHDTITGTLEQVSRMLNLLRFALFISSLALGSALFGVFNLFLTYMTLVPSILISLIPFEIFVGIVIYIRLLQADDDFVQDFNRKLRFEAAHISSAERQSELLFAYYLWNDSLCDPKKAPTLMLLYLIRSLSERLYQRIIRLTKNNLDLFVDQGNFHEAFKTVYSEQRNQRVSEKNHR